jgi:hypothetical protein
MSVKPSFRQVVSSLVVVGAVVAPPVAQAAPVQPIQIRDYFNFIDNREASVLGPAGVYLNVGVDVTPVAGTTVTAVQGTTTKNIPFLNQSGDPYQFISNKFAYNAALTGAWTLTITNPTAANSPLQVTTLPICPTLCSGANTPTNPFLTPFVTDVYTNGLSTTPKLTWTVPSYVAPPNTSLGVRVLIDQMNTDGTYSLISSAGVPSTATSYTVPSNLLVSGRNYVFSVQTTLYNTADVAANGGTQGSEVETSRAYFSFSPSTHPTSFTGPVALPVADPGGQFSFNLAVQQGVPVLLDPSVAVGYDFQVGQGDPLFASVALPDLGLGNIDNELDLWNGTQWVFDTELAPLTTFDFAAGGVDRFRVQGIPASLLLDPSDVTAFEAQVTFAGTGRFTGTMTALVAPAPIPEPGTMGLLGIAFGGLVLTRRRRGSQRSAPRAALADDRRTAFATVSEGSRT